MKYVLFTDAASYNNGKKDPSKPQHSYSGSILTLNGQVIKKFGHFNPNTTNNYGEIFAIYYGLKQTLKYLKKQGVKNPEIDVYSDSEICVRGLNEWIYFWMHNTSPNKIWKNKWYTKADKVVSNQEVFKKIYKLRLAPREDIEENKVQKQYIRFFHIKGHVNVKSNKDLKKAITTFKRVNGIEVPLDILLFLVSMNNAVDEYAVKKLKRSLGEIK